MPTRSQDEQKNMPISNDNGATDSTVVVGKISPSAPAFQGWMRPAAKVGYTVSANEITSLSAMIAYVAHLSGESEFRVGRRLSDRFSIANVTCLPADQFDTALRYLADGISQ